MATSQIKLKKPDAQYLNALRNELVSAYFLDDQQIDLMRSVRTLTKAVLLDEEYRLTDVEVRDPTITDEIQRVAAALGLNDPSLSVAVGPAAGDKAEENATLREDWTEQVLKEAGTKLPGHDTFRDAIDAAVGDGGAWTRLVFRNDTWDARWRVSADLEAKAYDKMTELAKKESGQPFVWECVDVRTLYPVFSAGTLTEVLVVTVRKRNSALRQFRLGVDADGRLVPEDLGLPSNIIDRTNTASEVTVLEHWDNTYYTQYCELNSGGTSDDPNMALVNQLEHKYGRVPFFYAPGYTMGWQQGRKVGWSIAESKRWLVEYRSYLMTLFAQVAARDAMKPVMRMRTKPANPTQGDDLKQPGTEVWKPREIINLEDGEELKVLDFGPASESLKDMLQYVTTLIDALLAPKVGTDLGGSDPGSGFAISQILAETRIREDPITKHIEQMLNEVTAFLWKLVRDKVKEVVWVQSDTSKDGWLGAGPDDLGMGVRAVWSLDPERASAKLIEHRDTIERMQAGLLDTHQAMLQTGENPDEVEDGKACDRIRTSPWYIQRQDEQVMQALQAGDILKQAAQSVIASGMLPGQGTTAGMAAMGNAIVPDMGQLAASSTGGGPAAQAAGGPAGASPVQQGSLGGAQGQVIQGQAGMP